MILYVLLRNFNEMQAQKSSMEATSPTALRPGVMHVDAADGFGGWSVEL